MGCSAKLNECTVFPGSGQSFLTAGDIFIVVFFGWGFAGNGLFSWFLGDKTWCFAGKNVVN
jgi:hypothetical protein